MRANFSTRLSGASIRMSSNSKKKTIARPFSSESARKAQPLAVNSRRATDKALRAELAALLSGMPIRMRREVADLLPIRQVQRLRHAALSR